jgi:tetratricopeptide (TPR) repeat protein
MKKLALFTLLILAVIRVSAHTVTDTVQIVTLTPLDSLKQELRVNEYDSLKAGLYAQIAALYLDYDKITNKREKTNYQNEAISYSLLAMRNYSKYNDTVGMRNSFDNLVKVYRAQKKFSQAKWFVLQSNTLSRAINDVPNIIASLIQLAAIKTEIKDYSLAMRDLNEALKLTTDNRMPKTEVRIQESYAWLYSKMKNYTKEAIALKRRDFLNDSIHKAEQAQLAKLNATDSVSKKKLITLKKTKPVSSKKMASL